MAEYTQHPMIRPAVLAAKKDDASGGIVAFRPPGSGHYLLYGDDAVAFAMMFGIPPGCYFRLTDERNVYAVPADLMDHLARQAQRVTKHVVKVHGVRNGCDPNWFV